MKQSEITFVAKIAHFCEGVQEYDKRAFIGNHNQLQKIFQNYLNHGIIPRVGDVLFCDDWEKNYYVKQVVFYSESVCIFVDEDENRIMEDE